MDYVTVLGEAEATFEIKRSIFIGVVKGIENFDEGLSFVRTVQKKYGDAKHNCYAVVCGNEQKFSDNGEPQGTAGMPILQVIKKKGVDNVALVVTRYFGGIKLGAGGLVSSYTRAAADCLDEAVFADVKESFNGEIECEYSDAQAVESILRETEAVNIVAEYSNNVTIRFVVPVSLNEKINRSLAEKTNGKRKAVWGKIQYIKYEI